MPRTAVEQHVVRYEYLCDRGCGARSVVEVPHEEADPDAFVLPPNWIPALDPRVGGAVGELVFHTLKCAQGWFADNIGRELAGGEGSSGRRVPLPEGRGPNDPEMAQRRSRR